jgi:hypothetical protein
LMGKVFAAENDDSRRDTLRASLIPALLPNPLMGLVMSAVLAKRGAQEPKAVVAPPAQGNQPPPAQANQPPPQGNQPPPAQANQPPPQPNQPPPQANPPSASRYLAQFAPPYFFPSFLGLSWRHALRFAELVGVTPHSHDESDSLVVVRQSPHPGEDWRNGMRDVHLHFGQRNQIGL